MSKAGGRMGGELARLASAAGSDPALMALAASSFAEAMIRRELGCPDDKDRGFRELARDLARRPGGEELAEVLTLLSRFRDIANDARHRFSPADPEEGRAAFYLAGELASALDPSGEPPPAWTEAMRGLLAPWRAGEPREEGPALIAARETLGHIDGRALDREIAEWEMLGRELARVETGLIAIAPGRTKPADLGRARDEGAEGLRSRRRGLLDSLSGLREAKAAADSLRRMLAPIAARRLFLRREGLATPRHTAEIGRALAEFLADAGGGADPEGAVAPAAGARGGPSPFKGPDCAFIPIAGDRGGAARRIAFECGVLGEPSVALSAIDPAEGRKLAVALSAYGIAAAAGDAATARGGGHRPLLRVFLASGGLDGFLRGGARPREPRGAIMVLGEELAETPFRLIVAGDADQEIARWWADRLIE